LLRIINLLFRKNIKNGKKIVRVAPCFKNLPN